MKTAIIFSSKHGTTTKVAEILAEKLGKEDISLYNLKNNKLPSLQNYDSIILGTSIYAGNPIKKTKIFAKKNLEILKTKKLGLFICGMDPGPEKHLEEMKKSYPNALLEHANVKYYLGGEFIFEDMDFLEKFIAKKVSKMQTSISLIHHENIEKFVKEYKGEEE